MTYCQSSFNPVQAVGLCVLFLFVSATVLVTTLHIALLCEHLSTGACTCASSLGPGCGWDTKGPLTGTTAGLPLQVGTWIREIEAACGSVYKLKGN